MSYATVAELAAAVRVQVTSKNSDLLELCVDAASVEIDHECNRFEDSPIAEDDPIARGVCIARGVEWFKANDSAFGALGFDGTGVLRAPDDPFARHAATLIPLKQQFGVA